MVKNIFNIFDLYAENIPIYYKNRPIYSSYLGFILTLISIVIYIILVSIYLRNFVYNNSFTLIVNQFTSMSNKIDITNIPFAFSVVDLQTSDIIGTDEGFFEFEVSSSSFKNGMYDSNNLFNFSKCSNYINNDTGIQQLFSDGSDPEKFFCIEPKTNIILDGSANGISHDSFGIRIMLYSCYLPKVCHTSQEYDDISSKSKIIIKYLGYQMNHFNENPITQIINENMYSISSSIFFKYFLEFNKLSYFIEKDYFLFKNKTKKDFFDYGSNRLELDTSFKQLFGIRRVPIAFLNINAAMTYIEYIKTFTSLQTVFAECAIYIKVFEVILSFIVKVFVPKILIFDICDNLCDIISNSNINDILKINKIKKSNRQILVNSDNSLNKKSDNNILKPYNSYKLKLLKSNLTHVDSKLTKKNRKLSFEPLNLENNLNFDELPKLKHSKVSYFYYLIPISCLFLVGKKKHFNLHLKAVSYLIGLEKLIQMAIRDEFIFNFEINKPQNSNCFNDYVNSIYAENQVPWNIKKNDFSGVQLNIDN